MPLIVEVNEKVSVKPVMMEGHQDKVTDVSEDNTDTAKEEIVENVRHSTRSTTKKLKRELEGKFYLEHLDMLTYIKDTDKLLSSVTVPINQHDQEKLSLRRTEISARFDSLQLVADELEELQGEADKDIAEHLDKLSPITVDMISKIVTSVSRQKISASKSTASKRSKKSTTSSRRVAVAAETAALQEKLAAQKRQNKCKSELQRLEIEEDIRRKEAAFKMEQLRRELEEERLEGQLKAQEAKMRVYEEEENDDVASSITVRSSKQLLRSPRHEKGAAIVKEKISQEGGISRADDLHIPANQKFLNTRALDPESPAFYPSRSSDALHNDALAEALLRTMTLTRLPIPEPPVFMGDPLQYPDWLSAFTTLIECQGIPANERIHYLRRYLGGSARDAVSGFFLLKSERAFEQAKEMLEKRFGSPFTISEAFRSKLDAWPKIANKDHLGLQNLSDFLQQCLVASAEIKDLDILNDMRELNKICSKLPDWIGHRWNRLVAKLKRGSGRYPSFQEFVSFLDEEADIANDPYVTYEATRTGKDRTQQYSNQILGGAKIPTSRQQRMTLSTANEPSTSQKTCIFCEQQNHKLDECRDFSRGSLDQKRDFVKKKGLCFGCLNKGHMSKECPKRNECKVCSKRHPTSLHYETFKEATPDGKNEQETQSNKAKETTD